MENLGTLPGDPSESQSGAMDVSADGAVVVGSSSNDTTSQAFRWTEADGMVGLGYLPGGTNLVQGVQSAAAGVSADGGVVVGESTSDAGYQAFRWTEADGMVGLGYLPGGTWSNAAGVSADGTVVVGKSRSDIGNRAFRWTEAGGMVDLGYLPGAPSLAESGAMAVSADGAVVVGWSDSDIGPQAFRWTEVDGMEGLGYLPGIPGATFSRADGVSTDGTVAVGVNFISDDDAEAFRWTDVGGMESIHDLLSSSGIDLTDWYLLAANDVSKDGSVIVGTGRTTSSGPFMSEAWVADLSDVLPLMDISGSVKTAYDADICAMVLAGGKHMFSCNPPGQFSLTNIPRETNGTVKRQIYADGFFPKIDILTEDSDEVIVMSHSGVCSSYNTPYDPGFIPDAAGNKIDISGTVLLQDTQMPVCAMVLANGQHMFSCDGTGSYALNIPLDTNGQFKLQVYADGSAPAIQTFDEFQAINDVRMARATECQ